VFVDVLRHISPLDIQLPQKLTVTSKKNVHYFCLGKIRVQKLPQNNLSEVFLNQFKILKSFKLDLLKVVETLN
jgi:hypothetical protein